MPGLPGWRVRCARSRPAFRAQGPVDSSFVQRRKAADPPWQAASASKRKGETATAVLRAPAVARGIRNCCAEPSAIRPAACSYSQGLP
eukprot:4197751-Alexandrium_andersonii.AAC.1